MNNTSRVLAIAFAGFLLVTACRPALAGELRFCTEYDFCGTLSELCAAKTPVGASEDYTHAVGVLCKGPVIRTLSHIGERYLPGKVEVNIENLKSYKEQECDNSFNSFLYSIFLPVQPSHVSTRIYISSSPGCLSDGDFISTILHELGHAVSRISLGRCAYSPSSTVFETMRTISVLTGSRPHSEQDDVSKMNASIFAFDEGFANFFREYWFSSIVQDNQSMLSGSYRNVRRLANAKEAIGHSSKELFDRNEFLTAVKLLELSKKYSLDEILAAQCPFAFKVSEVEEKLKRNRQLGGSCDREPMGFPF